MAECPQKTLPPEAHEVIEAAWLCRKGLPPMRGGAVDQAKAFLQAAAFVWREEGRWREQAAGRLAQALAMFGE